MVQISPNKMGSQSIVHKHIDRLKFGGTVCLFKKNNQKHCARKNHNQYFTPEFAAEKALSFISGFGINSIIDPAVGNGVFLRVSSKKWAKAELVGVDIDKGVICELNEADLPNSYLVSADSILGEAWKLPKIKHILLKGGFDLVVGNPPFSSWFQRVESEDILSNYELAKNNGGLKRSQAIEILFLEIFVKLAKVGGFIVIVLPDGILANPQYQHIREFILRRTKVLHIISLPRNVFEQTSAKTSILILSKQNETDLNYFTELHDLEKNGRVNNTIRVRGKDLIKRMDYFYQYNFRNNPLQKFINSRTLFRPLKDFIVYCRTGKTLYGEERKFSNRGLRFLHATNITHIGINYKKDERFIEPSGKMYFQGACVKCGDILFVRVGVGCAGRVAVVDTKNDEGMATDYIHIFSVKDINPYFLVVYLKTRYGRDSINLLKHGVGTVSINKTDLLSIPIPVVSEDIQVEIERRYKSILSQYRMVSEDNNPVIDAQMANLISFAEQNIQKGMV